MTASRRTPRNLIDLERAVTDDDYYADVRKRLRGPEREWFEAAVDATWREKQAQPS